MLFTYLSYSLKMKHKSKYGLNSGNTLKFRGHRLPLVTGSRSTCQNYILKTVVDKLADACTCPSTAHRPPSTRLSSERAKQHKANTVSAAADDIDVVPDGDMRLSPNGPSPVRMPLLTVNKRKRWLLPALVADCIRNQYEEQTSVVEGELRNATSKTRRQRREHRRQLELIEEQLGTAVRVSVHRHVESVFGRTYGSMDCRPGVLRRAGITHAVECSRPISIRNASGHVAHRSAACSRRVRNLFYDRLKVDRRCVRSNGVTGAAAFDVSSHASSAAGVEEQPLSRRMRSNTRGLQRLRKNDRASNGKKIVSNSNPMCVYLQFIVVGDQLV